MSSWKNLFREDKEIVPIFAVGSKAPVGYYENPQYNVISCSSYYPAIQTNIRYCHYCNCGSEATNIRCPFCGAAMYVKDE